ncbi:MAG TPA: sensor histidine kinase [Tepidisphaeraceae bacterium]|nr:sensor histidine kinase [Tepidisphaeraceae bacterium]
MSAQDRHFDIDASIVFQLGEGLISDSVQALVELIKNSWDADGTFARVTVNTTDYPPDSDCFFHQPGYILIEDDGAGMNEDELINGWLLISNSPKRDQKARRQKTGKQRTPLGEKGLGRLGVQRLGNNIEITTEKMGASNRYHVGWSWNDFRGKKRLSELRPKWGMSPAAGKQGTKLLITDLRDKETWEQKDTLDRFKVRLSQMISPYTKFPQFKLRGSINNRDLELADISEKIRSLATLRYVVEFNGNTLTISGRMRVDYIRPPSRKTNSEEEQRDFDELVADDQGDEFFAYLAAQRAATRFKLEKDGRTGWFCRYSTTYTFDEIDKAQLVGTGFANPGPFYAEIDSFNLEDEDSGVFSGSQQYKQYVKDFGGVRVFRDGFGIRTDEDWLGLGRAFTQGGSFYALRPGNVMGYVAISAEQNQSLVEATDREGFIDTPAYRNFVLLLQTFARFGADAQEFVRRGYNAYRGQRARRQAEVSETAPPDEVARALVANITRAAAIRKRISEVGRGAIADATRDAESLHKSLQAPLERIDIAATLDRIGDIRHALKATGTQLQQVQGELQELSTLTGQAKLLQHQVETLQQQMKEAASTISLGLTAEALSHEVANVADRLSEKTNDIAKYLSRAGVADERVVAYAEHVRTTVNALRKQMAHLAPSLRFARERRQSFDVRTFLGELSTYHNERWADAKLSMVVRGDDKPFWVRINQGKLTQVIDNLVINSEYWLKEALRVGKIDRGVITARFEAPHVKISDNGSGIDSHIEPTLFQPFNSAKKNGRGLGLFIVRQLLDSDNCSITVSPRRNAEGRLHQFVVDLSGVLDGESR